MATHRKQAKCWCFTLNNPQEGETLDIDLFDYLVVGNEVGEEGTPHFQGYGRLHKQKRLHEMKAMLPRAHWEIAKGTAWENRVYCTKDGEFVEHGKAPTAPKTKANQDEAYAEAIASQSIEEGIGIIRSKRPRDYCLHGESIERNLKKAKVIPTGGKYELEKFACAPLELTRATLLWGPSAVGKTQFALAHFGNPLFVSHIDDLKQLNADHDGVVFDDMSFRHWPIEAVIHLLDIEVDRTINVRYGTVRIPAYTIKIFTHNTENPFYNHDANEEQKEAVNRRLQRVQVLNKLY